MAQLARLQRAALSIFFAGVLAIPALLGGSGDPLHVGIAAPSPEPSPSTTTQPPAPVIPPPPEPHDHGGDHPITPPTAGDFGGAPDVVLDDDAPQGPGAVPVPVATPSAPSGAAPPVAADNVYALIIGINDYPGSAVDLQSAVADADDMVAALLKYEVPAANIVELVDGDATSANIARGLSWLVTTAPPGSTAVFYYSGHARKLDPITEAIVGADGILLTDRYLARKLAPLQSRDAWIVMSACFGGGFDEMVAPGRILTAAADADSLAYENDLYGRSYLGEFLVRRALIEGKAGGPTVQQAFAWAQAALQQIAPDRALSEVNAATGPISLDGVSRTSVPPVGPLDAPDGSPPPVSAPPPTQPPAAPVCNRLLGLLCPRR